MRFIIERGRVRGEKKKKKNKERKKEKNTKGEHKGGEGKEKTAREIKGKLESKISRNIKGVR